MHSVYSSFLYFIQLTALNLSYLIENAWKRNRKTINFHYVTEKFQCTMKYHRAAWVRKDLRSSHPSSPRLKTAHLQPAGKPSNWEAYSILNKEEVCLYREKKAQVLLTSTSRKNSHLPKIHPHALCPSQQIWLREHEDSCRTQIFFTSLLW